MDLSRTLCCPHSGHGWPHSGHRCSHPCYVQRRLSKPHIFITAQERIKRNNDQDGCQSKSASLKRFEFGSARSLLFPPCHQIAFARCHTSFIAFYFISFFPKTDNQTHTSKARQHFTLLPAGIESRKVCGATNQKGPIQPS